MNFLTAINRALLWSDMRGQSLLTYSFLLVYLCLVVLHCRAGLNISGDTEAYILSANQLIEFDFNFFAHYKAQEFSVPPPFFLHYPSICDRDTQAALFGKLAIIIFSPKFIIAFDHSAINGQNSHAGRRKEFCNSGGYAAYAYLS